MNRKSIVYAALFQILVACTLVCTPIVSRATTVATPVLSPAAGTYTSAQTVTITDSTGGSTIYFTTNGSTPSTSSTKYTSAITVSATETLKAIGTAPGDMNSSVATSAYTLQAPTPTFSPAAGTYNGSQTVTISDSNSGATIYYTTNGTTPATTSSRYTSAITVNATETLEAIAVVTGYTNSSVGSAAYTFVVPTPTFSPAAGTYSSSQTVTISDSNSGASIYYTTNGTTPSTSSTAYSNPISVSASQTVKALAVNSGYTNSAVGTAAYTINYPAAATPTFNPAAGTYNTSQTVTISDATTGAIIYYTTNGTTPSTSSTQYTGAIIVGSTETLEAIATATGHSQSAVGSAAYILAVAPPTFSPGAGTYYTTQTVTISTTTPSATIYYTTNGTTPSTSSTAYSNPISVSASQTVEALAVKSGYTNSAVGTTTYTLTVASPSFSPVPGSYTSTQTVTVSDVTAGATIYYTTNGTTPTTGSTRYTGAITVSSTEILEAIAIESGFTNSGVTTAGYTITPGLPTGTLNVYLSPPDAESTTVAGAVTETFDALSAGIDTNPYVSVAGIGTYTGSSTDPYAIMAPDLFGGATDSSSPTSPTNYIAVGVESGSSNPVYLTLSQPASYFGFWWAAGDEYNRVALYSGSTLYGTFSTADLLAFLNNGVGTITATNGTLYQASSYFGNPNLATGSNDGGEPFAYVSFSIAGATINKIAFYNTSVSTGFESDNHSVIFTGNSVSIPTTYVPVESLSLGSQVLAPTFNPVGGSYSGPQTVTISTTTAGASINYTTDGTTPSSTVGTLYTGPIAVSTTETIQAIAFETGMTSSAVVSAAYTIPVAQTISFSNPGTQTVGTPLTLVATASSGLTAIFTSATQTICTVSGTTATFITSGACTIDANQAGNGTYAAAPQVAQSFQVNGEAQTISFSNPGTQTVGTPLTLVATASSGLTAIFTSATQTICTVSGTTATFIASGACTIDANQAGNGTYAAAPQAAQSFQVNGEAQTISFSNPGTQTVGTPLTLVATASSGLTAIFTSATQTICTVSGTTATFIASGTCTIDANQAGNGTYAAAPQVAQSFQVNGEAQTISFSNPGTQTVGTPLTLVATASSGLTAIFTSATQTICTVSGTTATFIASGTCTIDANQAGNGTYAAAPQAAQSFQVNGEAQTISFSNPGTQTVGTPLTLVATASSGLTAIFTSATQTICTVSGTTATFIASGTCTIDANQAGNGTYAAAPQVAQSFQVNGEAQCATSGYGYQRAITIDHTKVPNTDQINFPFLFNTTDPAFATISNGGHVSSFSGYDIIFSTDPNGLTKLDHEMETYNPATGQVIAWVRIPTLSHTADTVLYVFYGNPSVASSQQDSAGVWDSNYEGVWHLEETAGSTLYDSTSNTLNGRSSNVVPNAGQIDGAQSFSGQGSYIEEPSGFGNFASGFTFELWANPSAVQNWERFMDFSNGAGDDNILLAREGTSNTLHFEYWNNSSTIISFDNANAISLNQWQHLVATVDANNVVSVYKNGALLGSTTASQAIPIVTRTNNYFGRSAWSGDSYYAGEMDELRISTVARSADWIAAEYNNQSLPSTFYALGSETGFVSPSAVTLYASQSQLFSVTGIGTCGSAPSVNWTITPAVGTISASGMYTAPDSITTQQTVTIEATSQAGGAQIGSATVTLYPSASVSVTPAGVTLNGGQTAQFTANVANAGNTAVTWTLSPAVGTISTAGLYTSPLPVSITTQRTVIVTATSVADTTQSASATVTLIPPQCTWNGYSYKRAITIDHTKIPNTDQINFPFLFNTTDPGLATISNGGHVSSSNGYDIIFTSDPAGQNILNYEMEEYDPVHGQVIAWVRIPTLSHTADTTLYVFYGNPSVATSQQNPSGVWDANYVGVWHLPNGSTLSANDSTTNGNNGSAGSGATATAGIIDGGASFNGSSAAYIGLPTSGNEWNFSGDLTLSAWIKTTGNRFLAMQLQDGNPLAYLSVGPTTVGGSSNDAVAYFRTNGGGVLVASGNTAVNDGRWHHVQVVRNTGETVLIYVDGSLDSTTSYPDSGLISDSGGGASIGGGGSFAFNGVIDEARISKVARSSDWIATEHNNESSPATFYSLTAENVESVVPNTTTLYASQSEHFVVSGLCESGATMIWSMPPDSPGTLSASGLYYAPESIETKQTVTITATTLGATSTSLTATVTLEPPIAVSATPPSAMLYGGQAQQFAASVNNTSNTAVTWTVSPAGVGTVSATGLYTAPTNLTTPQTVYVTATSVADTTKSASATITLSPPAPVLPVTVSMTPSSATLYGGQSQQLTASVSNTTNTAVTWAISPAGVGNISAAGLYTAPATITTQQDVTITVTSQADTTQSASAIITLSLSQCASSGYGYQRAIVISHTMVPNTDQTNFPFLFNTTDPLLATTANGGHVMSANGNDIIFSMDPYGQTVLDYELESYNPATGQVIAWVRIPTLSHSSDTTVYMFYGNPNISTPQQNPTGVWDSNYRAVYHFANTGTGFAGDSTSNSNNGTNMGAIPTQGEIDGGASFNGSSSYISTGFVQSSVTNYTVEAWINTTSTNAAMIIDDRGSGAGHSLAFGIDGSGACAGNWNCGSLAGLQNTTGQLMFGDSSNFVFIGAEGTTPVNDGNWHHVVGTWSASPGTGIAPSQFALYVDGAKMGNQGSIELGSDQSPLSGSGGTDIGTGMTGYIGSAMLYYPGLMDEVRISTASRSADWITVEYNNQSSPSTFTAVYPENAIEVTPSTVVLYAAQSQQLTATGICAASVNWSMPANSPGILTSSGSYTAPAIISTQQTVPITATSQTSSSNSATATVTLMPPVSVSIAPASVALTAGQTQLFAANVANSFNAAVTWAIASGGAGSISAAGVYTAPATIATQQTVTVTATSVEDPTKISSATITLSPTQCTASGYGYQRVIVIDHTKVPNTDQTNFPFLFNTTDADLATIVNGGHVESTSGYDILFSTDPNGLTKLDYEMEEYNPVTGQVVAWVRIPTLLHSTDTVLYAFYGNPNITGSQQNPTGVWNRSYQAVYHLANAGAATATDSTTLGNNVTQTSISAAPGKIDGAASLNGTTSYMQIPEADFASFPTGVYDDLGLPQTSTTTPFTASFGVWFKTASPGGILVQTSARYNADGLSIPTTPGVLDPAGWNSMLYVDENGSVVAGEIATTQAYDDNNWHFAVITYASNGTDTLYIDGQSAGSSENQIPIGYSPAYSYFVGTDDTFLSNDGNWNWLYFNGELDEVHVTNAPLSSDWIQTEYNNQGSPATFYKFYPRSTVQVAPSAVSLYASETQQFAIPGSCNAGVTWTLQSGAQGTLTSSGLYTAPGIVATQQTDTVTATGQTSGTIIGSATVSLLPPPAPLTLAASSQPPYTTGSSQAFTATVLNQDGTPAIGVVVEFTVSGVNSSMGSSTTNSNGIATYSYSGANSGSDIIQATAVLDNQVLTSNSISASWIVPLPVAAASVTLTGPPALGAAGLVGAFTDSNGSVIEPIAIGAITTEFVIPGGATQLQLGVDSEYYAVDGGPGFAVAVNGVPVTVPPTAMPWNWATGGLNNNYQYGLINPSIQNGILDGTSPVVAATGLTAGQIVTIAYQGGTASVSLPAIPLANANGLASWITGTAVWQGTPFPTLYTTPASYPVGQPITFDAQVVSSTGIPEPGVTVTLNITGANVQQMQAITDATGTAAFLYTGLNAGTDNLEAQATPSEGVELNSTTRTVNWTNYPVPSGPGSLALSFLSGVNNEQIYTLLTKDGYGNPVPDANLGYYVWGADNIAQNLKGDDAGNAAFNYTHVNAGPFNLVAVTTINGNVIFSNVITGTWTPPTTTSTCDNCNAVTAGITAQSSVTIPNQLQLTGTVTDTVGITPTILWSQISGPGIVTFSTPQQANTTATFSEPGTYVVQLYANDTGASAAAQFQVTAKAASLIPGTEQQGWIGSPLYNSSVSGLVPITLAPGVSLTSGKLIYAPAGNTDNVTILNMNTTGSGQIGTLDTTALPNGPYWIQLQGVDASEHSEFSLILVTVTGNYKPGRVTASVTDLVVPSTGLAINIQRNYDSLNAGVSSDFGYGWSLGINVNLTVSPSNDVTFTLGGQTKTFYFTPQQLGGCTIIGCMFPEYTASFTPEPGFKGTLTALAPNCTINLVYADGDCVGGGPYTPAQYTYTDPNGTAYNISASGGLQSITDRSGNGLTITAGGITSTTGLNVPFVRDDQNRITQITDPQGNHYLYTYDDNGNLATVTYPATSTSQTCSGLTSPNTSQYIYYPDTEHPNYPPHFYAGGTDGRCNPLPVAAYYDSTSDGGNSEPRRPLAVRDRRIQQHHQLCLHPVHHQHDQWSQRP